MREGIWFPALNVLNLKYERLVHNSAKVVSLQVFGKFSVFPPYMHLHLRSVHLRLFVSVYPFASICLLIAFVYLSASIIYLSICMRLSIASICVCLPLPLCLSGPVCLSVGLPVYRSVGNHSVCLSVACLSVASLSVCVSVTTRLNLSVRLPTSWGRHPASPL